MIKFEAVTKTKWTACVNGVAVTITKRTSRVVWPAAYQIEVRYPRPRYKGCASFKATDSTLARAKRRAVQIVSELTS